ncbi:molybdate transport system substrate-binding protein [Evansella vedderi]|uniref:Molybdate transport system substrate-binding protein n=1 Tax=Evansella vedderi TaxID=38282 RepID=A0ABU0A1A1_9BACI|nr:molybdate ABC transporter substrate-binding protein [Evansella vedderi]MDQ0257268.1 molybdate transport system substrate-binding protein [Evansella vedderi]
MKRIVLLTLFIFSLFTYTACSNTNETVELHVMAAASLTDVMNELKSEYELQNPHVNLIFNFSSSGRLRQQITQGAPGDLFISASSRDMDLLESQGDLEMRADLLQNQLVVITPADSNLSIVSIEDLLNNDQIGRIAIGQPEMVPVGHYAKEALETAEIWTNMEHKIIFSNDTRQALTYVETANVDAGIVYVTDTVQSNVNVFDIIDADTYSPIYYPMGIMKNANPEITDFYHWLQAEEAQHIFQRNGFKTIP